MNRHAYLLMLHDHFPQAARLIKSISHARNDIYIHIDAKADFKESDRRLLMEAAGASSVFFTDRISVSWADTSLTRAELILLEAAAKGHYACYHLLSGADLLLKPVQQVLDFFDAHPGREFVSFSTEEWQQEFQKRCRYYWLFQKQIGRPRAALQSRNIYKLGLLLIQRGLIQIQKLLHVDRRKKYGKPFAFGSNWFSITHDFAAYVLAHKDLVLRICSHTVCSDESFLQTLLVSSPFCENRFTDSSLPDPYFSNMRFIDFHRGNPYVFRLEDYDQLMNSGCLFARKFSPETDDAVIKKIYTEVHHC